MHFKYLFNTVRFIFCIIFYFNINIVYADDGYDLWMKYKFDDQGQLKEYKRMISTIIVQGETKTIQIIQDELKQGLDGLLGKNIPLMKSVTKSGAVIVGTPQSSVVIKNLNYTAILDTLGREGFLVTTTEINGYKTLVITANEDIGLLYGTFHLLRLIQTRKSLKKLHIVSKPKIQYRLINHWDNLDETVERGYAGKSLWKWDELPEKVNPRYQDYARANASIGINGTVVNNVNANPDILKEEYLKKIAKLADIFRPYGIQVFLSINFSSPISAQFTLNSRRGGIGNLTTSDPLNPEVRQWWKDKVKEIYRYIPDFGGFLVKANSEGMPGPQDYGRTHVDGASMLAEALEPYNGIVMWRALVYNPSVDPDRAKRAYKEFVPLDGTFHPNVFIQAKNGPVDFQPREPVQPLFGATPNTPLMMELQITQEYLGHSKHLVYLAPMWQEYLQFDTFAKGQNSFVANIVDGSLYNYHMIGIAGVSNIGSDRNWCGHLFGQANWYAFGRLAWDHALTAENIADEWIRMTISNNNDVIKTIKSMMLGSWEACINYMTPLGLHHIMQPGFHYGPGPDHSVGRLDWTSVYYHRADSIGLGFDRSSTGSNATSQYFLQIREKFDKIDTCPEKYLLWFHHVDWNHKMESGRTLWDELCYRYFGGVDYIKEMIVNWETLEKSIDPEIYLHVKNKLKRQKKDSMIWQNTCIEYFQKFSRKDVPEF